nr:mycofactocin precursor MftA [Flexivirga oryzae]
MVEDVSIDGMCGVY